MPSMSQGMSYRMKISATRYCLELCALASGSAHVTVRRPHGESRRTAQGKHFGDLQTV